MGTFTKIVFSIVLLMCSVKHTFALDCEGTTQLALNKCASADLENADSELGKSYRQLQDTLEPDQKLQLKRAERAWIGFRDEYCQFVGQFRKGGSMEPMVISLCMADMTREQVRKLQWQLTCRQTGGDCSLLEP